MRFPAATARFCRFAVSANHSRQATFSFAPTGTRSLLPRDVLDFWYGGAWGTDRMDSKILPKQVPLWFGYNVIKKRRVTVEEQRQIDDDCRTRFAELIRACGRGDLDGIPDWCAPDGLFAKMLLTDQLSRNSFRGTAEAFAFDEKAIEYARKLYATEVYKTYQRGHFQFLLTPGQHSERLEDHEMNLALVRYAEEKWGADSIGGTNSVHAHHAVIKRFGRFPHRNKALGRDNTPEEDAYLADVDSLPAWAKRS
eukprot:TRINITY_DN47392_c0_g1_i1.p1 TRINITY_DN47392_c0_g1~~TRINITY_DN47392_c0_g1_i1.p1  ORF type:complete len:253 (-),score=18.70 TRINITY_DN47392_c0_g1_i1:118-876(-)